MILCTEAGVVTLLFLEIVLFQQLHLISLCPNNHSTKKIIKNSKTAAQNQKLPSMHDPILPLPFWMLSDELLL